MLPGCSWPSFLPASMCASFETHVLPRPITSSQSWATLVRVPCTVTSLSQAPRADWLAGGGWQRVIYSWEICAPRTVTSSSDDYARPNHRVTRYACVFYRHPPCVCMKVQHYALAHRSSVRPSRDRHAIRAKRCPEGAAV